MKKLIVTLLVSALLAVPAMAADISLVDNGDGTGTIQLTTAADEVVRGLAIVVDAGDVEITEVAKGHVAFNVFMDAAYEAETATPGSYTIGDGSPVADPEAAGTMELPAMKISLSMGVLDNELPYEQAGAPSGGTIDVATIKAPDSTVTITADTLRGGIVGDNVVDGTIAGGDIGPIDECIDSSAPEYPKWVEVGKPDCWCDPCFASGDATGDSLITGLDVQALVAAWGKAYDPCVDFNKDGLITGLDVQVLVASWGIGCP